LSSFSSISTLELVASNYLSFSFLYFLWGSCFLLKCPFFTFIDRLGVFSRSLRIQNLFINMLRNSVLLVALGSSGAFAQYYGGSYGGSYGDSYGDSTSTAVPASTATYGSDMTETKTVTVPCPASMTASGAAATHSVVVGGDAGLVYTPNQVNANPGDKITFDFRAMNHTVTQSSLDTPCVAMPGGAKSGFRPNKANTPGVQLFDFTVPNDKPQWFYCGQANHCESGMVFAVNPAGKFDIFLSNAKNTNPENPTQVTASAASKAASMATVTVTEDCSTSTTASPTESMGSGYGTSTAVSAGATHPVVVGGPAGLVYTPQFVNADVGDVVEFDFRAMNHTVTQSSLDLPCMALPGGAKSGFRPNPANTPGVQIFKFTVSTDKPQWFYCGQADHCEKGMVFAINPAGKFDLFKQHALNTRFNGTGMGNATSSGGMNCTAPTAPSPPISTGAASSLQAWAGAVAGIVAIAVAALA